MRHAEHGIFNPKNNNKNCLKSSSETIDYKKSIFVIPTPRFQNYWIIYFQPFSLFTELSYSLLK